MAHFEIEDYMLNNPKKAHFDCKKWENGPIWDFSAARDYVIVHNPQMGH